MLSNSKQHQGAGLGDGAATGSPKLGGAAGDTADDGYVMGVKLKLMHDGF
jgi:hypothetical protein